MTTLTKITLLYVAGICLGFCYPGNLSFWVAGGLVCFLFALAMDSAKKQLFLFLAIVLLAAAWSAWHIQVSTQVLKPFYGKEVQAVGWVVKTVERGETKPYSVIHVQRVNGFAVHAKVRLYSKEKLVFLRGDRLVWQGKLVEPPRSSNPGESAYFWAVQDIQGFSFLGKKVALFTGQHWLSPLYCWQEDVKKRLQSVLPEEMAGLTSGILFGDEQAIPTSLQEQFRQVGLIHVLAASGQNVFFLTVFLVFWSKMLHIPNWLTECLLILMIICYMVVVGFTMPIVRAGLMALFLVVARLSKREVPTTHSLAFTALLILLVQPLALFQISFQLSFLAILSLLLLTPFWAERLSFLPSFLVKALSPAMAVETGLMPLMIYYFQAFSPVSILANLLILPLLEGVLFLSLAFSLIGMGLFAASLGGLIWSLLSMALYLIARLAALPFAFLQVAAIPWFYVLLYYVLLLGFWWKGKTHPKQCRIIAVAVILLICCGYVLQIFFSPLKVVFFDVGQGDSLLIRTPSGKTILIDGGPRNPLSLLKKQGIRQLDYLVVSHFHDDHYGGIVPLLDSLKVAHILVGERKKADPLEAAFWDKVDRLQIPVVFLKKGDGLQFADGVFLDVLHPDDATRWTENNLSLVLRLRYREVSMLFTGDLEEEGEEELLRETENLASDLLKIGHHGSKTSTTPAFLKAVQPQCVVLSVGKQNRFGHPAKEVLQNLQEAEVYLFRTDRHGAIVVTCDGVRYRIKTMKKDVAQ